MPKVNKYQLPRDIPVETMLEIRRRSKFGCVLCRCGLITYEHILPEWHEAAEHNPDNMCCLCGSCHLAVTTKAISKQKVRKAYDRIQAQTNEEAGRPIGPLDFHDGNAELVIGGLPYAPAVRTILRYHGIDLVVVKPGSEGEQGSISAFFTDPSGAENLRLFENQWIGPLDKWDVDSSRGKLRVRHKAGETGLSLKLNPPGKIIVERLDMRFRRCHLLATATQYALGVYLTPTFCRWVYCDLDIRKSSPFGAVFELTDSESLWLRDDLMLDTGQSLAPDDRSIVIHNKAGVMIKDIGVVIASMTGEFVLRRQFVGDFRVTEMRKMVFSKADLMYQLEKFKH